MRTQRGATKIERPKNVPAGQRYFWTTEWQRGEREASRDIVRGRVKQFKNADELIRALHRGG